MDATVTDIDGHLALRVRLTESYYPSDLSAGLLVRWYTNDDCKIRYREHHGVTDWEQRWDRHPNSHNTRDHLHPPPDAPTHGEDPGWPVDYREMTKLVLDAVEERIAELRAE
ncbi:MAG: hypothetical protein ABEH90_00095 [Halolamina sp.]